MSEEEKRYLLSIARVLLATVNEEPITLEDTGIIREAITYFESEEE